VNWRRLESDADFQELFARGPLEEDLRALERQIFDPLTVDPVKLAELKGRRLGILRVLEVVTAKADQERGVQAGFHPGDPTAGEVVRLRPSDSPLPSILKERKW